MSITKVISDTSFKNQEWLNSDYNKLKKLKIDGTFSWNYANWIIIFKLFYKGSKTMINDDAHNIQSYFFTDTI